MKSYTLSCGIIITDNRQLQCGVSITNLSNKYCNLAYSTTVGFYANVVGTHLTAEMCGQYLHELNIIKCAIIEANKLFGINQ